MSGTSHPEGKQWALARYLEQRPRRVLDIGPGNGTYARLFRPHHRGCWTALEVHAPYIERYQLDSLYDLVLVRDARDWPNIEADLVILGDVVEHVTKPDGIKMLGDATRTVPPGGAVLLSIPLGEYRQGPIDGNEHETHLATWTHDDVVEVLGDCDHQIGQVVGVYWWTSPS